MNRRSFFQILAGLAAAIATPVHAVSDRFVGKRRIQVGVRRLTGNGDVTVIIGKDSIPLRFERTTRAWGYGRDGSLIEYGENVPRIEGVNYFTPKEK